MTEANAGTATRASAVPFCLAVMAVGFASLIFVRYFDQDEFEHLQFSWLLSQGLIPYRDFFEHHTPLFHMLMLPAFWVFDANTVEGAMALPYVFRLLAAGLALATIAATWRLAIQVSSSLTAALTAALLLCSRFFLHIGMEIRGDQLGALALLVSASALHSAFVVGRAATHPYARSWLCASGFAAAIAVLATQKALFGLPGLALAGVLLAQPTTPLRLPDISRLVLAPILGAALAVAPMLAFFAAHGALGDFVHYNFLLNAAWPREGQRQALLDVMRQLLTYDPLLVVLSACGVWRLLRELGLPHRRDAAAAVLLPLASLLIGLAIIPVATSEYVFLFAPFSAIAAAHGFIYLVGVGEALRPGRPGRVAMLGMAGVVATLACTHIVGEAAAIDPYNAKSAPLRRLAYVVGQTSADATILPGWIRSSGVILRRPAFFYHMPHWEVRARIPAEHYAALLAGLRSGTVRPELIALDEDIEALPAGIVEFLRTHYEPVGIEPLMRRKPDRSDSTSMVHPASDSRP